jgi:hypothetical protein
MLKPAKTKTAHASGGSFAPVTSFWEGRRVAVPEYMGRRHGDPPGLFFTLALLRPALRCYNKNK